MRRFFGKYRGKIVNNKDPFNLGRVQVSVPSIFGEGRQSWAMPSTPYAGKDIGFFAIPPVDSNVWVEFEGGDTDYPIWTGCFWSVDELPQIAKVAEPEKIQVFRVNGITLSWCNTAEKKGVFLEVDSPVVDRKLQMKFDQDGIELNNKDELTIKIKADLIEIKNRSNSTITINTSDIQLKENSTEITATASSIDLNCNPATIKLSNGSGIEIANMPATAKFSSSGIELGSTPASVKITSATIELSNTAANVKLSPISVNVNNGALEVI